MLLAVFVFIASLISPLLLMRVGLSESYSSLERADWPNELLTRATYVLLLSIYKVTTARDLSQPSKMTSILIIFAAAQPFNTLRQRTMFHTRLAAAV